MTETQDKFDYEVPDVSYEPITNDDGLVIGHQVHPPFALTWDHLTTLRHFAALIEHRTGTKIRVAPLIVKKTEAYPLSDVGEASAIVDGAEGMGERTVEQELYDVLTAHTTGGPAVYEVTWAWLSGFETGIHELLWSSKKKEST